MESIVKAFLSIFLLVIVTLAGVGIVSTGIDASNAEKYIADVSATIEDSNFSQAVISQCVADVSSENSKYKSLEIKTLDLDKDGYVDSADVTLAYEYSIPFFSIGENTHYLTNYIR